MTLKELDKKRDAKMKKLDDKKLSFGIQWLSEYHSVLDWYYENLKKHGL